jgi:sugar fermentation stimulation protein A
VHLEGQEVLAHLPDPGRLRELLIPGTKVWVRPASGSTRKTRFTLALVLAPSGELVSVVTTLPNELVAEALGMGRITELADWQIVKREHTWGRSRFDFLLGRGERRMLLEVKSVTLVEGKRALFPDAVTARGARHVSELARARADGHEAAVLFVVQRRDARSVTAARSIDPKFADALSKAAASGVRLHAYRSQVTLEGARITEPIPVLIA